MGGVEKEKREGGKRKGEEKWFPRSWRPLLLKGLEPNYPAPGRFSVYHALKNVSIVYLHLKMSITKLPCQYNSK